MQLKERSFILSVGKPYNFVPEGEKEPLVGCKMFYVGASDILQKHEDTDDCTLGYFPQKETMPPEFYEKAIEVGLPAYADITYDIKLKSKGSDVHIVAVEFIKGK